MHAVGYVHVSAGASRIQKSVSDPLELELQVVLSLSMWKPNSDPLQEPFLLLTAKASLQSCRKSFAVQIASRIMIPVV